MSMHENRQSHRSLHFVPSSVPPKCKLLCDLELQSQFLLKKTQEREVNIKLDLCSLPKQHGPDPL